MVLTEQECIDIAEKVWGFTCKLPPTGIDLLEWELSPSRYWKTPIGELLAFDNGICAEVRSYEGMGRTLEAMRDKGYMAAIYVRPESQCIFYYGKGLGWGDNVAGEASNADLLIAVHRAALAALESV